MSVIKKGDIFPTNQGYSVSVIDYINCTKVLIEFNDDNKHQATVEAGNLRKGAIRNPYHPSVYGKGCFGAGDFVSSVNHKLTSEHQAWSSMMDRCYGEKTQMKQPTYLGCSVHPDWLNFQNFAKWYTENEYYGLGYHLDKDILFAGNKEYSSDKCVLVPKAINNLLIDSGASRGEHPIGVSFYTERNKFAAELKIDGKRTVIGYFDCPNEAYQAYKTAKEAYVKAKATEWKDRIDPRVFTALMNWRLEK